MDVIRAIALAATLTSLFAGCRECSLIDQVVTLPAQDDDLQPLVDACATHVPDGASGCAPMSSATSSTDTVECGCLALCRRLLTVIDQFQGSESLIRCRLLPSPDAGWGAAVDIRYRPSTCP